MLVEAGRSLTGFDGGTLILDCFSVPMRERINISDQAGLSVRRRTNGSKVYYVLTPVEL